MLVTASEDTNLKLLHVWPQLTGTGEQACTLPLGAYDRGSAQATNRRHTWVSPIDDQKLKVYYRLAGQPKLDVQAQGSRYVGIRT